MLVRNTMTTKIITFAVLVFLLIPTTQSVQKKYPSYSSLARVDNETSLNKAGAAASTRSKEESDEESYNARSFDMDQFKANRTPGRSDNSWISDDKTKGRLKEDKTKDINMSSARSLISSKILEVALPSHRAFKDLGVTFDKGGRRKRMPSKFAHSRFTKVADRNDRYPSYTSPGTKYYDATEILRGTSSKQDEDREWRIKFVAGWYSSQLQMDHFKKANENEYLSNVNYPDQDADDKDITGITHRDSNVTNHYLWTRKKGIEIDQDDSNHLQNNNVSPEFANDNLEGLMREMLLKQKVSTMRTRMEQYNTVWDMKFKLVILFLIMGFMIVLFVGSQLIKLRFRRIDPDDMKARGNLESDRCKSSMKKKKGVACFDTFLEKLRAHYRRKSESNSRLGDRASQRSIKIELNKIESERQSLLTEVRHIQPPPECHSSSSVTKIYSKSAITPSSSGSSSSHTYSTAKEVASKIQLGVAPSGSRGKIASSSQNSVVPSKSSSSFSSSRSRGKIISTTKRSACPSKDLSTSCLREGGSSLFPVVPILNQINFIPSESKYPVPSESKNQSPSGSKGSTPSGHQAPTPSRSNGSVVSSINKTDDPLKGQVITDPNFQTAHESGSEETLYEQPIKFSLGKFYGSGGKRVYFQVKNQKKKSEKTRNEAATFLLKN